MDICSEGKKPFLPLKQTSFNGDLQIEYGAQTLGGSKGVNPLTAIIGVLKLGNYMFSTLKEAKKMHLEGEFLMKSVLLNRI